MIFSYKCIEHRKFVDRKVWLMDFSLDNLKQLWNKSKEHRILFSDDVNGSFDKFISVFLSQDPHGNMQSNGLIWIVDDFVGVLFMSEIKKREALLHFSFFDGRLRRDISAKMIDYIFSEYNLDRLNAEIVPFASKKVFNFVEEIGFIREGKKRKCLVYKNKKWDLLLYGLLRDEFYDKWILEDNKLVKREDLIEAGV